MSAAENITQSSALSGSRGVEQSFFRRLVSRAMARELSAFVVPGAEVARARGLDLRAAGLTEAVTPRHASVLVVVGELPEGLADAATVAYAQMPRPRAVLALGTTEDSLPVGADLSVGLSQEGLESGVDELRRRFTEGAFDPRAEDFEAAVLESVIQYVCPMHPEVVQDEPGTCPKCGMDLVAQEAGGGGSNHGEHDHGEHDHGESEEESDGEEEHEDIPSPVSGEDFMSMLEMTEGAPQGSDGLQMEWVRTPFGPLFPGLTGGLKLAFTMGGDTVEQVEYGSVAGGPVDLTGSAESLAERLSHVDLLSPVSYRLLAHRALEAIADREVDEGTTLARVAVLERERVASHLSWLAGFAHVIGYEWLVRRAGELQFAVQRVEPGEISELRRDVERLSRRVERTPLLRRRLAGIGALSGPRGAAGPVARASGISEDARASEAEYAALGFEPVVRQGSDALDRLRLRLAEIDQGLTLIEGAGQRETGDAFPENGPGDVSGSGAASVETPRGMASLSLTLQEGEIRETELQIPSEAHLRLVEEVTLQREVGDALVGVGSLDLSPWGLADGEAG
ncbi:NADH-quinone oxidoreductase subunit D-related protein [Rubrobacter aplysinae]|uniref:NADH-quinone oxidoreductase subunit D-related protein n=1 Tax=Rubrobacter aplysinae TaxID=909625 RepID=UPI00069CDA2A|nr:heavy metal-binding domain-containing protein [Rubrobacter aplysinae]